MLVLDQDRGYSFSNMLVTLKDDTIQRDDTITPIPDTPQFNMLIPTFQPVGITNTIELFYPGEPNRYLAAHGTPNAAKYGFGPDLIHKVLDRPEARVGVYTINLRGASATMSNTIVTMKYKVEPAVPYTDPKDGPWYVTPDGKLTHEPTGNKAVVRDVLHVKYVESTLNTVKKWVDLHKAMNDMYSNVPDTDGYKTIPWFSVMYKGASAFGNGIYFNMVPSKAQYDGNTYYTLNLFDGITMNTTDSNFSMDIEAGAKYGTTYYMENRFNETFMNLKYLTAEAAEEIRTLYNKYLYTIEDYIAKTIDKPSKHFPEIDPFSYTDFGIVIDAGSLDSTKANAFAMKGGTDGTETADVLFKDFFAGKIITDVFSPIQYRFSFVPDVGYDKDTKAAILDFVRKRIRMTTSQIMLGGADSFASALVDHQANYYKDMPNVFQIAKVQSPMRYNEFTRRTLTTPAGYFDAVALVDHFARCGNYYQPFAGASARWTDFIPDTMPYPEETPDFMNSLQINRINCVMKDSRPGAYRSDQMMNTLLESDQTELNNAFLISSMLYDLVDLVHVNHFKFNETEEVRIFKDAVNELINSKYAPHSASLTVDVHRSGTVGRAKSTNVIAVRINMKDINKFTDVNILLTND